VHIPLSLHGCALPLAAVLVLSACNTSPSAPERGAPPPSPEEAKLVVNEVVWPDAAAIDRAALGALPERAASHVRSSRVPVLLPAREALLAVASVVAKELWTSASMRAEGVTLTVTASRASHRVPGVGPTKGNRALRGTHGFVSQNEGIWSASWIENGVAYSVEVECASPEAPRCADEVFVTEVANDLAYVGGAGVEEVAR
jgi:hypothetical protein